MEVEAPGTPPPFPSSRAVHSLFLFLAFVLVVLVVVFRWRYCRQRLTLEDVTAASTFGGGGVAHRRKAAYESKSVVIDTLNLVHWWTKLKNIKTCDIINTIEDTAPFFRSKYTDRVIYVTKTRERVGGGDSLEMEKLHVLYQTAAQRNRVYIHLVERLPGDPLLACRRPPCSHAALGRDDFYIILLAMKFNCPVLSLDRFRDLVDMKAGHLDKFHVYSYSPFKAYPERDYVNPTAPEYARMVRPLTVDFSSVLGDPPLV